MHIHVKNNKKERARNLKSEGVEGMGGAGGRKRSTELIQLYLNKKVNATKASDFTTLFSCVF